MKYSLNGVEQYASTKCTKKFDAERVLKSKYIPQEVNAYNRTNVLQVKRGLLESLAEFRDDVLIHSSDGIRKKSAGTINRQQTNIRNFIDYTQQKKLTEFSEVTEDTIRDYIQNHLIKANEKKPNTVYKDVQILKNFFQWARKKYYCNEDPTVNFRNPKPAPSTPRYFTHDQVKKILTKAKEPYVLLQTEKYSAGSAQAELYPKDIDQFLIPFVEKHIQDEICQKVEQSLELRKKSRKLLDIAKEGVEKAIEVNEAFATDWIESQLADLGVDLSAGS